MDKFSIYELMSFFFPGLLLVCMVAQFLPQGWLLFSDFPTFATAVLVTIVATVAGLALHRLTCLLIKYPWFCYFAKKPIGSIVKKNTEEIGNAFSALQRYNTDGLQAGELFDKAYHFLQQEGKLDSAISFQSMYFFLRNIMTMCLLMLPICGVLIAIDYKGLLALKTILFCTVLFILAQSAGFYRMKMVSRVFNTYLVVLEKENINKTTVHLP